MSAWRVGACAIAVLALASCGTSSVGVCTRDGDCPSGDVCNLQGECVTPPSPPPEIDIEIDAGAPPPPDAPGSVCTEETIALTAVPPAVQLVLDQSATMSRAFDGTTRYVALREALTEPIRGVIDTVDEQVIFGATLYTARDGATCPLLGNVPRRLGNREAIADVMNDNAPVADNPLAETLARVLSDFAAEPPPAGAARAVIVATDGVADSCADSDDGSGAEASIEAARNLAKAGIEVHMISIDDTVEGGYLQKMANAGAGLEPDAIASARSFIVDSRNDIRNAVATIVREARCRVDARAVPAGRLEDVRLALGGRALTLGVDWKADEDEVLLLDTACDELLAAATPTVTAVVPCE